MKEKFVQFYMDLAYRTADLSYADRLQVGAIIVKDHRVLSLGYNGTPAGWDNTCEEIELNVVGKAKDGKDIVEPYLKTKDEVIHAEANAISKLARDGERGFNSTLFCTHAPCVECAKLIYGAGIQTVYYGKDYRSDAGLNFLRKCNIEVIQCQ